MVKKRKNIDYIEDLENKLLVFYRKNADINVIYRLLLFLVVDIISIYFIILIEYFYYLSPFIKLIFWWLFSISNLLFLSLILFLYFKEITKSAQSKLTIAATRLERHFSSLKDYVSNAIQLRNLKEQNYSSVLVENAVSERSVFALKFNFFEALNFKKRNKIFFVFLFLISVIILSFSTNGSKMFAAVDRLLQPGVYFSPPPPFEFLLQNNSLSIENGKDLEITLKIAGRQIPENVDIILGGRALLMTAESDSLYHYTLSGITQDIDFQFKAGIFYSKNYHIQVLYPPVLNHVSLEVVVPAYTGDSSFIMHSIQDLSVPEGTQFKWSMELNHTDTFYLLNDKQLNYLIPEDGELKFNTTERKSHLYTLSFSNKNFSFRNKLQFSVDVIKDEFPQIDMMEYIDSTNFFQHYYYIHISDDYGFKNLYFQIKQKGEKWKNTLIPLNKKLNIQDIYFEHDFSIYKKNEIQYRFVVYDNDGVNGAKKSYSITNVFTKPSTKELEEADNKSSKDISDKSENAQQLLEEIRQQMKDLYKKNMTENLSSWEKSEKLKNIREKQEQLQKMMDELKEKMQKKGDLEKFLQKNKDILEKQKQLEKLFDKLFDDEMKKLMEEMQKLEDKFNDKKFDNLQKRMDDKLEDLQKELERNLQLLKRFDVEKNLENTATELEKLAKKELSASDSLRKLNKENKLQDKINDLNKQYKNQKKNFEQTIQKNQELDRPMPLDDLKKDFSDLDSMMQMQQQMPEQNSQKKKMQNQMQQIAKKMQQIAKKIQNRLQQQQGMQMKMSIEALRQILDNLIEFSFTQEKLMNSFKGMRNDNPEYLKNVQKQKQLQEDFSVIQDSLYSLTQDIPQIATGIREDISKIKKYSQRAVDMFENRQANVAISSQQYVMTSANNLALFLSESMESLKKMQQNASGSGKGKQQKQQSGKPSFMQLKQQQQSLKQQMKQMLKDMQNGKLNKNSKSFSKRIAEMLAQQEILQQMLEQMQRDGELSPKADKYLKEIKRLMQKNEFDLVNKRISPELLNRQKKILSRMLESEKAEQEKKKEKKRKSTEGKDLQHKKVNFNWEKIDKSLYKNKIQKKDVNLLPFYKKIFENYKEIKQ